MLLNAGLEGVTSVQSHGRGPPSCEMISLGRHTVCGQSVETLWPIKYFYTFNPTWREIKCFALLTEVKLFLVLSIALSTWYILTSIQSQSICIMYDDDMILQSRNWPPSWEHTLCMCDDDYCFCVPNWLPDLGTASALAAVRAGTVDTRASNEGPHRGS